VCRSFLMGCGASRNKASAETSYSPPATEPAKVERTVSESSLRSKFFGSIDPRASQGSIDAVRMMAMRSVFDGLDTDGDGRLTVDEIRQTLALSNESATEEDAEALIKELRRHGSSLGLSLEDLATAWLPNDVSTVFADSSVPYILCLTSKDGSLQLLREAPARRSNEPIDLIVGGMGPPPGPFPPQPGQLFLLLRYPDQNDMPAVEAAHWLLNFLEAHVAKGSRVLFNSFSAGALWHLLAHRRQQLEALGVECRLIALYHTGMEGTDVDEVLSYIAASDWLQLVFTHHDVARFFADKPFTETLLASLRKRGTCLTSANFLAMKPAAARRYPLIYVGSGDEEVAELNAVLASQGPQGLDPTVFALHGSTQRKAAQLLYCDDTYGQHRVKTTPGGFLADGVAGFWLDASLHRAEKSASRSSRSKH